MKKQFVILFLLLLLFLTIILSFIYSNKIIEGAASNNICSSTSLCSNSVLDDGTTACIANTKLSNGFYDCKNCDATSLTDESVLLDNSTTRNNSYIYKCNK